MRQRENGETAKSRGGTSERGESEEMYKKKKFGGEKGKKA